MRCIFTFIIALGLVAASSNSSAKETFQQLGDFSYVLSKGILQGMLAKELCSCHYVTGLTLKACMEKSTLPEQAFSIVIIEDNLQSKTISVTPKIPITPTARASFNLQEPRKGCRLVYGMKEAWDEVATQPQSPSRLGD
jgi:hypothetical protein